MTTDSELEMFVREELHTVAERVTPRPDPYDRLAQRYRRGRLSRIFVGCVAALAAGATGVAVAIAPAGAPDPAPTTYDFHGKLFWVASLVDAAPRGGLGQDEVFTADLAARIEELSRDPDNAAFQDEGGRPLGEVSVRVIFADDLDGLRITALALQRLNIEDPRRRYPVARVLWLAGPSGATVDTLAGAVASGEPADGELAPSGVGYQINDVAPLAIGGFGVGERWRWVALAPPECQVLTAPATQPDDWRVEPTDSYLVRVPATDRAERWRVRCDDIVREERPAVRHRNDVDAQLLTVALAGAAGAPDRGMAEWALLQLQFQFDGETTGQPRIVWGGPLAGFDATVLFGSPATDVTAVVAIWPSSAGGHVGIISINWFTGPNQATGTQNTFRIGDEAGLVAVPLQSPSLPRPVVVVAPPAAATVRLVSADGSPLAEAPVADRVAIVSVDTWQREGLVAEAYDEAGARIATAGVATADEGAASSLVLNWD